MFFSTFILYPVFPPGLKRRGGGGGGGGVEHLKTVPEHVHC